MKLSLMTAGFSPILKMKLLAQVPIKRVTTDFSESSVCEINHTHLQVYPDNFRFVQSSETRNAGISCLSESTTSSETLVLLRLNSFSLEVTVRYATPASVTAV
ncbi:hypothetical protein Pan161_56310 [Gimesia algae]|uniref:Uncharacterized protein n=1 Tax=Gimesia algae TaxID=2527971 RepID=A0A517VLR4_9PLAN|nr:hypothetical protein Pan161_56310 [Gimesia algae]